MDKTTEHSQQPMIWPRAVAFAVGGAGYGLVIGVFALMFSGAGHGWNSASISMTSVFLVPVLGVALAYRHHPTGRVIAGCVLSIAIIIDMLLASATIAEGMDYVAKVWSVFPVGLVVWSTMWAGWQVLVSTTALSR